MSISIVREYHTVPPVCKGKCNRCGSTYSAEVSDLKTYSGRNETSYHGTPCTPCNSLATVGWTVTKFPPDFIKEH